MKTCSTCRFMAAASHIECWDEAADDYVEVPFHACTRIIHGNGGKRADVLRAQEAVVTDGSWYAAKLCVLPSFGCTLHEERAPTSPQPPEKP